MKHITVKFLRKYKIFENEKLQSLKLLKKQGFCNIIYLLKSNKNKYLIRVFKHKHSSNIKRKYEFKIQKKASKKNIAAKPYILDKKNDLMICEYINGKHKNKLEKKDIKSLIKSLKILHTIKSDEKAYDLKADFINYKKQVQDKKSKILAHEAIKELKKLKRYKKDLVVTHHDLNTGNILFHKNHVKFIDWEFTTVNDSFFDLANICVEFKLSKKDEKLLLKSYFNKLEKYHLKKLNSYKKIYINLWKLWFKALEKR